MSEYKIHYYQSEPERPYDNNPKLNNRQNKKRFKMRFLFFLVIFLGVAYMIFGDSKSATEADGGFWYQNFNSTEKNGENAEQGAHLTQTPEKQIDSKNDDRINVLLLGMGGHEHQGGYLTDTIMLVSIDKTEGKVAMLSVPRDLSIPIPGKGWRKINHVNAFAQMDEPDSGGRVLSEVLGDLFGIHVDYYVRVDFEGFERIVDNLGGIKVYNEREFDDYSYPVPGREDDPDYDSRFEHLHFDHGLQHMDGNLALKYARSRHGTNGEGNDFARSRRQQKIIKAVKDKLLSSQILKPTVISGIITDLNRHVSTNFSTFDLFRLWKAYKDVDSENIVNGVLDSSPSGLLIETYSDGGAYILAPRTGDFNEIARYVQNIFTDKIEEYKTPISEEAPVIDVRNGTYLGGLASNNAHKLRQYGFEVSHVGNATQRDFTQNTVYDLTYGEKMESLKMLKKVIGVQVSFGMPDWLMEEIRSEIEQNGADYKQPDFILILGKEVEDDE